VYGLVCPNPRGEGHDIRKEEKTPVCKKVGAPMVLHLEDIDQFKISSHGSLYRALIFGVSDNCILHHLWYLVSLTI
jgi:hypothetical protein